MLEQLNEPSVDSLHPHTSLYVCKESCTYREYTYDFVRDSASWSMSTSIQFPSTPGSTYSYYSPISKNSHF